MLEFVLHKAKISEKFDSWKDSEPRILMTLTFREFYDSKLSSVYSLDNIAISISYVEMW